ncbi:MAG: AbrB/MazE/SpoVT family DNA-binding domain-containing protein [Candidatus Woesearchaeota archaeon]
MKRHLIQLAKKTLVVSLPTKWVQKYNLKKGDEVEMEERDSSIMIATQNMLLDSQKKRVDITGAASMARRILAGLYKAGYDEMEVVFGSTEELEEVYEVVRAGFLGFEITSQGKNTLTIKQVSKPEENEFENILRRIFLIIKTASQDMAQAVMQNDKNWLQQIAMRDRDINKLADYCRRMLNKKASIEGYRIAPLYNIIEQLEKIGDKYKSIALEVVEKNLKPTKSTLNIFSKANDYFSRFYELFYKLEIKRLEEFKKEFKTNKELIAKETLAAKKEDLYILFKLNEIMRETFELNGPLIVAKM